MTSRLLRLFLLAILLVGATRPLPAAPPQAGEPSDGSTLLPFTVTERTLSNGLKVIVVPTGFKNIVSVQIPVQTGSRNEVEPGKSGFAHFFEHMMFRGTKAYPAPVYQEILTRAGALQNAYTTDDYTNYHTTFAREDLPRILEVEADRFQNLAYSEEDFKTESRAVLGEYNKNSADPTEKLLEAQREHAFTAHTYRHTTMGFLRDIEDMPNQFAYSKTFFDRWYRPEYTTLIVAGDVTAAAVMPLVEKYWGPWKHGSYTVEIPREPEPTAPVSTHVEWAGETLPWVTVAFRRPAFSTASKDFAALDLLMDLTFGPTSPLHKRLVQDEQKVDQFDTYNPATADPYLATVFARVKNPADAPYVRDAILRAFAEARTAPPQAQRLADARSNARYALFRTLDNTEAIAGLLARYVRFERSYHTLNRLFRVYDSLTPADLHAVAQRYFTDTGLVQTTLSKDPLPPAIQTVPALATLTAPASGHLEPIVVRSVLPQLNLKLQFKAGSAHDPKGKEGLAALAASMIAEAGSTTMRYDEIQKAFFPMAASFDAQVDKEQTTFTGRVHRDNWEAFAAVALPMLTEPGFRAEDFTRLKAQQQNALVLDLRTNNEEELGKERLQNTLFAGTPYGHSVLGTVAGLESITLEDVKAFVRQAYTRASLDVALSGDLPAGLEARVGGAVATLPEGPMMPAPAGVVARKPSGITVDIIEKDTRATAISFGHPIDVKRGHPDFPALYLARTWLGEHRSSSAHLYQRIRELRGMNYGDYAYIEAFPGGMFTMTPEPNVARRAQLFEVWIRPVMPENGPMALRIALFELRKLVASGLSAADFDATRNYLMKHVFLLTATQNRELGDRLDAQWYGVPDFPTYMREALGRMTLADVNAAVKRHLSGDNLQVVVVTKDAARLRDVLVAGTPSTVKYDAPKLPAVLAEDRVIGSLELNLRPEAVTITKVDDVFAR
jgi:zinc protease